MVGRGGEKRCREWRVRVQREMYRRGWLASLSCLNLLFFSLSALTGPPSTLLSPRRAMIFSKPVSSPHQVVGGAAGRARCVGGEGGGESGGRRRVVGAALLLLGRRPRGGEGGSRLSGAGQGKGSSYAGSVGGGGVVIGWRLRDTQVALPPSG